MKKTLLLLTFACFLCAGNQLSFAQTTADQESLYAATAQSTPKENANKVINLLARSTKLNAEQKQKVLNVFESVDKKLKNIDALEDQSIKQAKQAKMQAYINQKLQQILTEEQYALYLKKTATAY